MGFPAACPEIPVGQLSPALDYYRTRLGFTVDWANEILGLAGLSRGACRLFMSSAQYRQGRAEPGGQVTAWLNADSRAHVDRIHSEWAASGAVLDGPPCAQPWNLYEFLARDLDGNRWRVFYDFTLEQARSG